MNNESTTQEYSGGHDASSLEAPLAQGLLALFDNDTKGERTSYRLQDFLGSWQLIPERSVYSAGGPPKQATYAISGEPQEVIFTIDWVDQSDKPFHVVYTCIPDGARHLTDISPTVDEMQTAIIDNNLQTLSYKDGAVTSIADRKLAVDGQELEVLQRYLRPDGSELSILQFYIRG